MVLFLIHKGASLNIKDSFGKTIFHRAAQNGLISIMELLLKEGFNINEKDSSVNIFFFFEIKLMVQLQFIELALMVN